MIVLYIVWVTGLASTFLASVIGAIYSAAPLERKLWYVVHMTYVGAFWPVFYGFKRGRDHIRTRIYELEGVGREFRRYERDFTVFD